MGSFVIHNGKHSVVIIETSEGHFCLQMFPPVSQLDPAVYGPAESALKEEHIAGQLDGISVKQVTNFCIISPPSFLNYIFNFRNRYHLGLLYM